MRQEMSAHCPRCSTLGRVMGSMHTEKGWREKTTSGTCVFLDALFHPESPDTPFLFI